MPSEVKRTRFSRAGTAAWPLLCAGLRVLIVSAATVLLTFGCGNGNAACDEAKCASGERCVQDDCRPACTTSADCNAGQSCAAWAFGDGTQGAYCVVLPGADAGGSASTIPSSTSCTANADCAAVPGEFCVNGTCRLTCASHFDCQGFGECLSGTDSDGNAGHYCDLSLPQKPGQFYSHCPSGTDTECDSTLGFFCVGAGAGDLDAYCTADCQSDDTCAPGFACLPLTRSPCSDACGFTGKPKDRQCVPSDQIGVGLPYQCGSHGVTRNVCRPRQFCTPCANDADCFATPNQICAADQSGAKFCTELCDAKHPSCPWGSAGVCGVWDPDLGLATCAHRFGQCTGSGKSCEPCENDSDCGPNNVCTASSFTGERWCVDFRVSCSCNGMAVNGLCTGGGCPLTPGGLEMQCEDDPQTTGSTTGICVGANTATGLLSSLSSPQTGCWPAH